MVIINNDIGSCNLLSMKIYSLTIAKVIWTRALAAFQVRYYYCINLFFVVQYIVQGVVALLAANYSTVRDNFKDFCDKANDDAETIFITRKAGGNVVLLSEAQYNNLMENLYVRSNKKNYVRLMESIQQLKQAKVSERLLLDD